MDSAFTKPGLQRLSHQAGVKSMSGLCYAELRQLAHLRTESILKEALIYRNSAHRKTITNDDIIYAISQHDGMNVASSSSMKKKIKPCYVG